MPGPSTSDADGITGSAYEREKPHWVEMRLSDLYLIYAEALLQADGHQTVLHLMREEALAVSHSRVWYIFHP